MSWNHNFVRFYFSSVSKVCPFPPWHGFMSQVVKIIKLPVFSRSQYDYINFINFIFCEDVKSKCCFVAWPACWSAMYHASMLKESHGFLFWYLSVYCGGGAERWWSKAKQGSIPCQTCSRCCLCTFLGSNTGRYPNSPTGAWLVGPV